jgi:uncharacterized protein YraI
MVLRTLFASIVLAAIALPGAAHAWSSKAKLNIVLRNGPGTNYGHLTVIPAGATVEVYRCGGWCEVLYMGRKGFVYGKYVYAPLAEPLYMTPVRKRGGTVLRPTYVPPQNAYLGSAPFRTPSQERADWYAGRMLYFNGRFFDRPDVFFVYGR